MMARTTEVAAGTGAGFRITGSTGVADKQFTIRREAITGGPCNRLDVTPPDAVEAPGPESHPCGTFLS